MRFVVLLDFVDEEYILKRMNYNLYWKVYSFTLNIIQFVFMYMYVCGDIILRQTFLTSPKKTRRKRQKKLPPMSNPNFILSEKVKYFNMLVQRLQTFTRPSLLFLGDFHFLRRWLKKFNWFPFLCQSYLGPMGHEWWSIYIRKQVCCNNREQWMGNQFTLCWYSFGKFKENPY